MIRCNEQAISNPNRCAREAVDIKTLVCHVIPGRIGCVLSVTAAVREIYLECTGIASN